MAAILLAMDIAFAAALVGNGFGQLGKASHVCSRESMTYTSVVVLMCLTKSHFWHNILFLRLRLLCAWVRAVDYVARPAPLHQRQQIDACSALVVGLTPVEKSCLKDDPAGPSRTISPSAYLYGD